MIKCFVLVMFYFSIFRYTVSTMIAPDVSNFLYRLEQELMMSRGTLESQREISEQLRHQQEVLEVERKVSGQASIQNR